MNGENKSLFKYLNERITFLEEEIRFKNQLINNIMATPKSIKHNTTNLPQAAEDLNWNLINKIFICHRWGSIMYKKKRAVKSDFRIYL